jgi:hypothetical protein
MRIKVIPDSEYGDEPATYRDGKRWFAWFPVLIGQHMVWLQWVERRNAGVFPPTFLNPHDYRLPG